MTDVKSIIDFIDQYLEQNNLDFITPPDANGLLEKAGLLKDREFRSGNYLRKLLRKGELPHAFKVGDYWRIPKSK